MSSPSAIADAHSLLSSLHLSSGHSNNPTLIATLPNLWPSSPSPQSPPSSPSQQHHHHQHSNGQQPRLIIIGDVHGQLPSLRALLAKTNYSAARGDRVVLAGDAVNKGPDSAGVVALAMAEGFYAVRGNHEDRVLRLYARAEAVRTTIATSRGETEAMTTWDEVETAMGLSQNDRIALATARSLEPAQREWLAARPVMLRVGAVPGAREMGDVVVVHAGLVPGVALEEQDPWAVMNVRSLLYPKEKKQGKKKGKKGKGKGKDKGKDKGEEKGKSRVALSKEDQAIFEDAVLKKLSDSYPAVPVSKDDVAAEARRLLEHYGASASSSSFSELSEEDEDDDGDDDDDDDEDDEVETKDVSALSLSPIPIDTREGRSWCKIWNELQREKPADRRTTIVYGHDARKGLNIKEFTFGLDSGCVKGGDLTALVFEPHNDEKGGKKGKGGKGWIGGFAVRHRLVSVSCEVAGDGEQGKGKGKDGKGEKGGEKKKKKEK